MVWFCLVWLGLVCLVWAGQVWFGLVWSGQYCTVLVWLQLCGYNWSRSGLVQVWVMSGLVQERSGQVSQVSSVLIQVRSNEDRSGQICTVLDSTVLIVWYIQYGTYSTVLSGLVW